LSQATVIRLAQAATAHTRRFPDRPTPVIMESIWEEMSNYNSPMNLAGKASAGLRGDGAFAEAGYAMAALLVTLSVMAILLSAAMPTWSQMIRREKEEELIFRGTQYARAINQYQRKFANASPQTLDVLIEQRLLRKKFRDPMATDEKGEFQLLYLSSRAGGPQGTTGTGRAGGVGQGAGAGRGTGIGLGGGTGTGAPGGVGATYSTEPSGGIVGVASKNTGTSIKIYKEKTRYNEWQFIGMEQSQQAGPGGGAAGGPQRGGRGDDGRGGRGGGRDGGFDRGGGFGGRGREGGAGREGGFGGGGGRGGRGL
jgi:type II secretory pathway pseudopilin PulG